MGLWFMRRTFFYIHKLLVKTDYLERNIFSLVFECLITETLRFGQLFSHQDLGFAVHW